MTTSVDDILRSIYYDSRNPASFSSARNLHEAARSRNAYITLENVKDWLSGEFTYTLHKPIRKSFRRNPVIASFTDEQWQADLVDMQEFQSQNNGFKFILTVIDVFSKFAWARTLKSKSGKEVEKAFSSILTDRKPAKIQTDRGKEFVNKEVAALLKKLNIKFFTTKNQDIKCAVVERFNRTLKGRMFRYFTSKGTRKYIDVLENLVTSYNNTYHQSIKTQPVNVGFNNEKIVFKNLFGFDSKRELLKWKVKAPKLKVGDPVRLKYKMGVFDRGYYPNWSDSIYYVVKTIKGVRAPLYKIRDEAGVVIDRNFYPEELQKVKEGLTRVEKVLKKRKLRGKTQLFVKWLNHPASYNSWVDEDTVVNL